MFNFGGDPDHRLDTEIVFRIPQLASLVVAEVCNVPVLLVCYRQHCAQRKPAGISFTQRPILRFFAPQGRHVAPMGVKFGMEEGSPPPCQISSPSVQRQGCRTPKIEIFTQI